MSEDRPNSKKEAKKAFPHPQAHFAIQNGPTHEPILRPLCVGTCQFHARCVKISRKAGN
jgi:hypothetical protein